MEKFSNIKYKRFDIKEFKKKFNSALKKLNDTDDLNEVFSIINEINNLRNSFETMQVIASIRNSIDTTDKFYEEEQEYYDEVSPIYEMLIHEYYKILDRSNFKKDLKNKWGNHLFKLIEKQLKVFDESIIDLLTKENKLSTKYRKLRASAKIEYKGKVLNLSQIGPFIESRDRDERKSAQKSVTDFFEKNEKEFDDIYDKLVKIRHEISKKLGYDNFIQLGYDRLNRTDYDSDMVKNYRNQVLKYIVPISKKIREEQKHRLGYNELMYYDEPLMFMSGNPEPNGSSDWIISRGEKMYSELSTDTKEFIEYLMKYELLDLEAKQGKAGGGYCTFIPDYNSPFIFSNFNGTSGDVDVLTHEAGHAFQVYMSRFHELPEYIWPTLEACEIHSMSMEFLTWPWMKDFFESDSLKYKYLHLTSSLLFIPYGVTVDEFQHWVYKNPSATPKERKLQWRKTEKKYLPSKKYGENNFLEKGGYWFRQGHIFSNPFYYIDYTLAQICAFEFFVKSQKDFDKTWKEYLSLCKLGGSKPFLELVSEANLSNPFEKGVLEKIINPLEKWLKENRLKEKN